MVLFFACASICRAQAWWLKQSVDQLVFVWFYDASTMQPKTGLTVTNITCRTVKKDGTTASFSPTADSVVATHGMVELGNGAYKMQVPASDLSLTGNWECGCSISGSVSPKVHANVIAAPGSWDPLVEGDTATIAEIWAELLDNMVTPNSAGMVIKTNLDASVSSVSQAGVWTTHLEGNYTAQDLMRLLASALLGKFSGNDTNVPVFRDLGDTKNRIQMNVGPTGRTAVTLDPSD